MFMKKTGLECKLTMDLREALCNYIDRYFEPPVMFMQTETCVYPTDTNPACLPRASAPVEKNTTLEEMLKHRDAGFAERLLQLIDRSGKRDAEIYKKANVSRQHFSKIRNNPDYRPTKATALSFAIALELNLEETKDLIGRAGYALSSSSKFDLIIRYFIQQKIYDIMLINAALYEFDQLLLAT